MFYSYVELRFIRTPCITGGRPAGEADPGTPRSFYVFMGLLAVALLYFLAVLILA